MTRGHLQKVNTAPLPRLVPSIMLATVEMAQAVTYAAFGSP